MSVLKITASSQIGCIRQNNEDMILVGEQLVRNEIYNATIDDTAYNRFVVALADGMGGHNAGEVASEMVLANLRFFINDLPNNLTQEAFNEVILSWLDSINKQVECKGALDASMAKMGTTLVAIIYYGGRYYWINCGDSRLYRIHEGDMVQLTVDHSLNTLIGEKKHSNVLTNCIGAGCKTSYMDIMDFTDSIQSGDALILCSDGLNDMIPDEEIKYVYDEEGTADALCCTAVAAGGFDNVSVCVIDVE